jgi:hypothetical protein
MVAYLWPDRAMKKLGTIHLKAYGLTEASDGTVKARPEYSMGGPEIVLANP